LSASRSSVLVWPWSELGPRTPITARGRRRRLAEDWESGGHAGSVIGRPVVLTGCLKAAHRHSVQEKQASRFHPRRQDRSSLQSQSPGSRSARLRRAPMVCRSRRAAYGVCLPPVIRGGFGWMHLVLTAPRAPQGEELFSSPAVDLKLILSTLTDNKGEPHQRTSYQRPHPGPGSAVGWPQW
jgi:hypothetical protein